MVALPLRLRDAIRRAGTLPKEDHRRQFIIAIVEHMVLTTAQYQWGESWRKKQPFGTVLYNNDNTDSCA